MNSTKKFFLLILILVVIAVARSELEIPKTITDEDNRADWEQLKQGGSVVVHDSANYADPYRLPISSSAWEDGLYISRNGKHLYAFYAPVDIFRLIEQFRENPSCLDIKPLIRAPELGMDLTTNPAGCPTIMHSDIAYTSRGDVESDFRPWSISNIANPATYDGAFAALENGDGTIDAVYSRTTADSRNDLYWAQGVTHNPMAGLFKPLPNPINTKQQEDNPHLERLGENRLVLLFDNDGVGDKIVTIKYSLSSDNGASWTAPKPLSAPINQGGHDAQGHLYYDGSSWWLYFSSNRDGVLSIFRSRHMDSGNIAGDFDRWGAPERVISPGSIDAKDMVVAAVGEPTLTARGDISFVVAYCDTRDRYKYDKCDIDPWFLPRIQ
jgi:hypothetical protein